MKNYALPEAAEFSGIKDRFIRRALKEGLIKYSGSGRNTRFSSEEIELWKSKDASLADRIRQVPEKYPIRIGSYKMRNGYILPFFGIWLVGGGHCAHCTRYAWDFIAVDARGFSKAKFGMSDEAMLKLKLKSSGNHNPCSFLCYGRTVIAPAAGKIISAPEPLRFTGNNRYGQGLIVIDHGNGEYSRLCHVVGRTVLVRPGETVKQGQVLCHAGGRHGDGMRQVPHLHWDIWDHTHFLFAKGIPLRVSRMNLHNGGKSIIRKDICLGRGMLVSNL